MHRDFDFRSFGFLYFKFADDGTVNVVTHLMVMTSVYDPREVLIENGLIVMQGSDNGIFSRILLADYESDKVVDLRTGINVVVR